MGAPLTVEQQKQKTIKQINQLFAVNCFCQESLRGWAILCKTEDAFQKKIEEHWNDVFVHQKFGKKKIPRVS